MRLLTAIAERRSAIVTAAAVLLADQISKDVAVTLLTGEAPVVVGPLALTYARNPGAALGLFGGLPESARLGLVLALTGAALLFLLPQLAARIRRGGARQAAVALVVAGATGNLLDRVRHGFVVDFLTLNPALSERFPVFNLADVAVIAGALMLFVFLRRGGLRPVSTLLGVVASA